MAVKDENRFQARRSATGEQTDQVWRWTVIVHGICARATTTNTDRHRDALLAARRFTEAARRIVRGDASRMVVSVIPANDEARPHRPGEELAFELELYGSSAIAAGRLYERIATEAWTIGRISSCSFSFEPHVDNPTILYEDRSEPAFPAAAIDRRVRVG